MFLLCGCSQPVEGSITHSIDFSVNVEFGDLHGSTITPSEVGELENVVIIAPLPAFIQPANLKNLSIPEGWNAEVVKTPYGDMLKLEMISFTQPR